MSTLRVVIKANFMVNPENPLNWCLRDKMVIKHSFYLLPCWRCLSWRSIDISIIYHFMERESFDVFTMPCLGWSGEGQNAHHKISSAIKFTCHWMRQFLRKNKQFGNISDVSADAHNRIEDNKNQLTFIRFHRNRRCFDRFMINSCFFLSFFCIRNLFIEHAGSCAAPDELIINQRICCCLFYFHRSSWDATPVASRTVEMFILLQLNEDDELHQ